VRLRKDRITKSFEKPTLNEKLNFVWNGWLGPYKGRLRYTPKHNGKGPHSWDVWDRKLDRFVPIKEVKRMTVAEITEFMEN
jgi:hypothetical protein